MKQYIDEKVWQCMEEWKSTTSASLREILKKYFSQIICEVEEKCARETEIKKIGKYLDKKENTN